jgi:hypothetical protein
VRIKRVATTVLRGATAARRGVPAVAGGRSVGPSPLAAVRTMRRRDGWLGRPVSHQSRGRSGDAGRSAPWALDVRLQPVGDCGEPACLP